MIDIVTLARERSLAVGVRGGGHRVAGNGTVDGGVLIDLSSLKGVHVEPGAMTARANGGALWGKFDRETQLFGLATPGGRVTTTGIGGFTTGGGYGWLSPKFGLCDNLISADVVTADGRLVTASEDEHEDLFWGLRGGSSNFGIATSLEYRLHRLGPIVLGGLLVHPAASANEVARAYRDFVEEAPEEVVTAMAMIMAPPAPFVPAEIVGTPVFGIVALYVGDPNEGVEILDPLRKIGPPALDIVQAMPYTALQTMLDDFAPRGWLNYHRGIHLSGLKDDTIDAVVELGTEMASTSPVTQTIVFRHGGAVSRVPDMATAASHRDAAYMAHPIACREDPADSERHLDWVQRFSEAMEPFATGAVYSNFEPDRGLDHVRAGFSSEKYAKLVELKTKWDPENLFRVNQNIRPSGAPG